MALPAGVDPTLYDNVSRAEADGRLPPGTLAKWLDSQTPGYEQRLRASLGPDQQVGVDSEGAPIIQGMPSKDGFVDKLAGMIPYAGAALITGGASGLLGGGLGAAEAASAPLGSGITAGTTTGAIGEGALGGGLTAGSTATGIGGGATGTGLSSGLTGAGSALTPGYFATDGLASGGGSGGGALSNGGSVPTGLEMALRGIPGVVGALAANNQANKSGALAQNYMNLGAPARQRFESSFAPGFSMESDPGYMDAMNQAAKAALHNLSIGGNPAGSPNAWAKSMQDLYQNNAYTALQNYRSLNGNAGGLSGAFSAGATAANNAITQGGNVANALGGAAADIFTPRKGLTDLLKEINRAGY